MLHLGSMTMRGPRGPWSGDVGRSRLEIAGREIGSPERRLDILTMNCIKLMVKGQGSGLMIIIDCRVKGCLWPVLPKVVPGLQSQQINPKRLSDLGASGGLRLEAGRVNVDNRVYRVTESDRHDESGTNRKIDSPFEPMLVLHN